MGGVVLIFLENFFVICTFKIRLLTYMCTVTYVPKDNDNFILTSNRDEAYGRTTLAPNFYNVNGVKMLFPKDVVAGGSWIGISEKSRMICLLNGGYENHVKLEGYKMSRGVVVKELLKADALSQAIEEFDYSGIEPFTIVAIDWSNTLKATELVWDGTKAHITILGKEPKIWSSSTLYDEEMKAKRREWFAEFANDTDWSIQSLFSFHTTAGEGDDYIDLRMNRGKLGTVSVTQVEKQDEVCRMEYNDFQKEEVHTVDFEMIPA